MRSQQRSERPGPLLFIWVTSALAPPVSHAVADEQMAVAVHTGNHRALCGTVFLAGSMLTPPSPHCVICRYIVRTHRTAATSSRIGRFAQALRNLIRGTDPGKRL